MEKWMTLAQMFSPFLSLNTNYYLSIEPQYTPQLSILLPTASFIGGKQKAADGMVTEANTCTNSMQGQGLTGSWWVNSRLSQSLMVPEVHTAHTTSTTTLGWGGGWGVRGGGGVWTMAALLAKHVCRFLLELCVYCCFVFWFVDLDHIWMAKNEVAWIVLRTFFFQASVFSHLLA